ncbi:MAG: acyl-CoA reductase [Ferruginibacter sp.]
MNLQNRINSLAALGLELIHERENWSAAIEQASRENPWFLPTFIHQALDAVARDYLSADKLQQWTQRYPIQNTKQPQRIGIIMAGNIPLVGIHDLLCAFLAGHELYIRLSSKDAVLVRFFVQRLIDLNPAYSHLFTFREQLTGCDAYLCTGSARSAEVFNTYFGKYPNIIRGAKTSVAVLTGEETTEELSALADDVFSYFGLGCRNVTKLYIPDGYSFDPLLQAFRTFEFLMEHHRYKNNYDYQLSIALLNRVPALTNESMLLIPSVELFSAIGVLHYETYTDEGTLLEMLKQSSEIQCILGKKCLPFGTAQHPQLWDYADGTDTLAFLSQLAEKTSS